jgi:UDP-2-acetamido-2,6-beta-L-arabino-hexul-4-ose reductase
MRVLVTGGNGFLGKNLRLHLANRKDVDVICFTREHSAEQLFEMLRCTDFVFHFAGVNRPKDPSAFVADNLQLTELLCAGLSSLIQATGREIPVVLTSSTQAALGNPYGASKRAAEDALFALHRQWGLPVHVFRLPNVFGKWGKPYYNSVVATFCHNLARGLPIKVNDPSASLTLAYVEDVMLRFIQLMDGADAAVDADGFAVLAPQYTTTVGEVANLIQAFKVSRQNLLTERVGTGLARALYATYVSYLPPEAFNYTVPMYCDPRGVFAEMLKTPDCGQFSYFTAHPGVTRGGHYHHSKTEKFLVIKGQARFKFRQMQTGESYELTTSGVKAEIVETVPGWTHDITNIGTEEMIVMLWANEVFDRQRPDTFACPL